ncbi:MAG: carbohydrate ABC transporter permease [Clostridia bacterium]|nr:carbohydrate ABC transporter permease [Clostridia bacterium]
MEKSMRYVNGIDRKKVKKQKDILSRRTPGERIFFSVVFVVFSLQTLSYLLMVYWVVLASLKTPMEYFFGKQLAFPNELMFSNYSKAFSGLQVDGTNLFGMIFNTLWYTALATFFAIMMPCITGYCISKFDFKCKNLIYTVAVINLMIPVVGTAPANIKFLNVIGIFDTPLYVIWSHSSGFTGSFLIYYGFFKSVSRSYMEAAEIDGANHFAIFFKVMLPQAVPVLLTYAITNSISYWNDYQSVLMFIPSFPTLAAGLYLYGELEAQRMGDFPRYYAGLILSVIPPLVLFACTSSKIMTSLSVGGLKG